MQKKPQKTTTWLSSETTREWHLRLLRASCGCGLYLLFSKSWASKKLKILFCISFSWLILLNKTNVQLLRMDIERSIGNMWHLSNFQDSRVIPLERKLIQNVICNICYSKLWRLNSSQAWNVRISESIHWKSRNTVWFWHISSSFNKIQIWAGASVKPQGSYSEADIGEIPLFII